MNPALGASKMRAEGLQLNTNTSEVKCAHLGQVKAPCTRGEVILYNTQSSMLPGNFFLVILAALTWASSMSVSEHMYWFYVSHFPFPQLVDWTDPATVIFAND